MAFDALTTAECDVDAALTTDTMNKMKDNFDHLYGQTSSGSKVPNGSFEIDSDADGIPDQWDKDLYPGGSFSLQDADDDTSIHGAACAKFTHPGGASNGGGNLLSGYMGVSNARGITVGWSTKVSATGAKNQVILRYFDADKVDLSADDTLYSSTSGPTTWTAMSSTSTPPTNARFCKIKLIGGFTDTDPGAARDTYFDDIWLKETIAYEPGSYIINNPYMATSQTNGYNKGCEHLVAESGTINAIVWLRTNNASGSGHGKIYVNGDAVGTERDVSGITAVDWGEDIVVEAGDLVQLYLDMDTTSYVLYGVLFIGVSSPSGARMDYNELDILTNIPILKTI